MADADVVDRVQEEMIEIVVELLRIERRMFKLERALPMPTDVWHMAESDELSTLPFDLQGWISVTRQEMIQLAIDRLRQAALRTDVDLRREHRATVAELRRLDREELESKRRRMMREKEARVRAEELQLRDTERRRLQREHEEKLAAQTGDAGGEEPSNEPEGEKGDDDA